MGKRREVKGNGRWGDRKEIGGDMVDRGGYVEIGGRREISDMLT